ncbi:MAG: OmpA family protein [Myxococcales bacterium]|nr:OmpA family protein [Myxococcales bacterium]
MNAHQLFVTLACATLIVGCGIPKEKYFADLENERTQGAKQLKLAQDKAAEKWSLEHKKLVDQTQFASGQKKRADDLERELLHTKKTLDEATAKGGNKAKALAKCSLERRDLLSKLDKVRSVIAKVRNSLKAMSDAGKLQVKLDRGFLIIALQGDILFDTGKSKLKDAAKPVLLELAGVLKLMPDRLFQVAGHTDSTGKDERNWQLSMGRAWSVVGFLLKEGEVPAKNLSVGGYGSYQPTASNEDDAGRATNRRVEFLLVPNLTELFK